MVSPNDEMEKLFLALSDKTRIKLIGLMSAGEVSVNYLCDTLGESQPKISRHLAYLRATGVVTTKRDGKWIFYSLSWPTDPAGAKCFDDILDWITQGPFPRRTAKPIIPAEAAQKSSLDDKMQDHIYENADMSGHEQDDLDVYLL
jgi:DNA-binding transcriptional ArsR family regulator